MDAAARKMLDVLKELRDDWGCFAVKAEFEAEGSRTDEMIMLKEVIDRADMRLIIKIGGCEAVRDLDQCKLLGAYGVMGPMIETPFAMSKFENAAKKVYGDRVTEIDWIINTETKTCHENLDDVLDCGEGFLKTIAIGRVDYSASLGLSRTEINNEVMLQRSMDMASRAKRRGLAVGFGGGISFEAIPFIREMASVADRFETRKVVFEATADEKTLQHGILKAIEFEAMYLKNKCAFYNRMANEDRARLKMMYDRIEKAESLI